MLAENLRVAGLTTFPAAKLIPSNEGTAVGRDWDGTEPNAFLKAQANLLPEIGRSHGQRSAARIERDYLWSRPSCSAMSLRLGASYAFSTGQVPV